MKCKSNRISIYALYKITSLLENSHNQECNRQIEKDSVLVEDIQNRATKQLSAMSFQGYLMRRSKIHAVNNSKYFVVVFKGVLRPIS